MHAFAITVTEVKGQYVAIADCITRDYQSETTLLRYGVRGYLRTTGKRPPLRVEVFYNWDRRYGEPDKVIIL